MFKPLSVSLILLVTGTIIAAPVLQMNRAFMALTELIPFITEREKFMERKNDPVIIGRITELQAAFKSVKHETVLKEDLFAPSYALINENISSSLEAFKNGEKDYAHWRLKEITSHCLDCHTRMPISYASSFQNGDLAIDQSKFENAYNLGIAQLIVRRYADAKASFTRSIQEKLIKKEFKEIALPFKQILLIETKILKSPENLNAFLSQYGKTKELPQDLLKLMSDWQKRISHWKGNRLLTEGLKSDKEVETFIAEELEPLKKKSFYSGGYDVDLLIASGLLSNFLFENPASKKAPEISFWLGWAEKYLKRENYFGSGDLFLKQCIKRYPTHPIAKNCLAEYKESVEFEFSGSSGMNIPSDIQKELKDLGKLIKVK